MGKLISLAIEQMVDAAIDASIPTIGFSGTRTEADMAFYKVTQDLEKTAIYTGAMESLGSLLSASADGKGGINQSTEEAIRISTEALHVLITGNRLQNKRCRFPSREDFGTNMSRKDATVKAAEGFSELASTAKKVFMSFLEKIIAWFRQFWQFLTRDRNTAKANAEKAAKAQEEGIKEEKEQTKAEPSKPAPEPKPTPEPKVEPKAEPEQKHPASPEAPKQRSKFFGKFNAFSANGWSVIYPNPKNSKMPKVNYDDPKYPNIVAKAIKTAFDAHIRAYVELSKMIDEAGKVFEKISSSQEDEVSNEDIPKEEIRVMQELNDATRRVLAHIDDNAKVTADGVEFYLPLGLVKIKISNDGVMAKEKFEYDEIFDKVGAAREQEGLHDKLDLRSFSCDELYLSFNGQDNRVNNELYAFSKKLMQQVTAKNMSTWALKQTVMWASHIKLQLKIFEALNSSVSNSWLSIEALIDASVKASERDAKELLSEIKSSKL